MTPGFHPHPAWPEHLLFGSTVPAASVTTALSSASAVAPRLPPEFLEGVCVPLAGWIAELARVAPCVIAVGGPPGSGKSTLARTLVPLLDHLHGQYAVSFSLDDVYLTREERQKLARDIHPILATRGPPGTHDLRLAHELLDRLPQARPGDPVWLPRFDKRADDRAPPEAWQRVERPPAVVLVDAWFWGVAAPAEHSLAAPINAREAREDPDGRWRHTVWEQLTGPYPRLFRRADRFVELRSPSWQTTLEWRIEQEVETSGLTGPASGDERARLRHFLELFERVAQLPTAFEPDLVLRLGAEHRLVGFEGRALLPP